MPFILSSCAFSILGWESLWIGRMLQVLTYVKEMGNHSVYKYCEDANSFVIVDTIEKSCETILTNSEFSYTRRILISKIDEIVEMYQRFLIGPSEWMVLSEISNARTGLLFSDTRLDGYYHRPIPVLKYAILKLESLNFANDWVNTYSSLLRFATFIYLKPHIDYNKF